MFWLSLSPFQKRCHVPENKINQNMQSDCLLFIIFPNFGKRKLCFLHCIFHDCLQMNLMPIFRASSNIARLPLPPSS